MTTSGQIPADVFTEQDADPDTLANLGPLRRLAGTWQSATGADINPKADGPEHRQFIEHAVFEPIDAQANGPQLLYGLRYHMHINTPEEDITFHDQVGYWLWEPDTGLVMQSLTIPRGQAVLAAGHAKPDDDRLMLTAARGRTDYGIVSTTFLEQAFQTDSYRIELTFNADGSIGYVLETMLRVHGQPGVFNHRDTNRLVKIAEPEPNPLMRILAAKAAATQKP